jgi:hypothetical protein
MVVKSVFSSIQQHSAMEFYGCHYWLASGHCTMKSAASECIHGPESIPCCNTCNALAAWLHGSCCVQCNQYQVWWCVLCTAGMLHVALLYAYSLFIRHIWGIAPQVSSRYCSGPHSTQSTPQPTGCTQLRARTCSSGCPCTSGSGLQPVTRPQAAVSMHGRIHNGATHRSCAMRRVGRKVACAAAVHHAFTS